VGGTVNVHERKAIDATEALTKSPRQIFSHVWCLATTLVTNNCQMSSFRPPARVLSPGGHINLSVPSMYVKQTLITFEQDDMQALRRLAEAIESAVRSTQKER
jgi:hypothetical protein